jgi:putative sterol carrier protein
MGEAKSEVIKLVPLINSSSGAMKIMEGWPRSILLELDGEENPFFITIEQGKMRVEEKSNKEPDIIMLGDAREIAKVFRGDKDITHPLAHGQLRLKRGKSIELVIFLSRILGGVHRKKLEA